MTTSAADETAPSVDPQPIAPPVPASEADQAWTRGTATYPPTGTGVTGPPQFGQPLSFDTPGYGYGYPAAPGWAPHLDGPKAWPIAVFTVFFGIFGAISAARRSSDARALGLPSGRYWGVFAGALVGSFALWTLVLGLGIAVSLPASLQATTTVMTPVELEQELEASNSAGGTVTGASCAEEAVDPTGTGTYQCLISFGDGAALPYLITVSDDGSWAASATE